MSTTVKTIAGKFAQVTSGNGTWGYIPYLDCPISLQAAADSAIDSYWGKSVVTGEVVDGVGVHISGTADYYDVYNNQASADVRVAAVEAMANV